MGVLNQEPTDPHNPEELPQHYSPEPSNLFSMLRLNGTNPSPSSPSATAGGCDHLLHHPPCTACGCHGSISFKRRSPESDLEPSRTKKPSCEQEDHTRRRGYSEIPLPLSLETLAAIHNTKSTVPVLRRCISDPYAPPSAAAAAAGVPTTPFPSPEHTPSSTIGSPTAAASRLPPRPPSLKRCVPDPAKTISASASLGDLGMAVDLCKDEASSLMRLRRMKDRLREMRQWWDEVMQENEEREEEEDADEGDKVVSNSKDDIEGQGGAEEVVSVEWVEKCLSITFKCPCGKGYQILLSGNKCYYKLV